MFVARYIKDPNATSAAIAAGYSERTARSIGSELLTNPNIAEAIRKAQFKLIHGLEVSAERVVRELARLAFSDARKFFREDGTAKDIGSIDDDSAAAIAGIEVFEEYTGSGETRELAGYTKKFKIADKGANLERLGKHLGLFKEASVPSGFEITVRHIGLRDKPSAKAK